MIIGFFPGIYYSSSDFALLEGQLNDPQINDVHLLLKVSPTRTKSYWFFIYCMESQGPYTFELMASPAPGKQAAQKPFTISSVTLQIEDDPPIQLIDSPIETTTLETYNWQSAEKFPFPKIDFRQGMKIVIDVNLSDASGNTQRYKLNYVGEQETQRSCLAHQ
ncbi:hypothetical protein N9Y42_00315 [Mariniblastus sp.]|nr:hypothetical protein [Mariniblastus sp.]